jgi:hypothetical protein
MKKQVPYYLWRLNKLKDKDMAKELIYGLVV